MKLVIIHIGKCAGSVVCNTLKKNNIEFTQIHVQKAKFKENKKYVILLRNPVSRFISAFNWRYKLVLIDKTQKKRFYKEKNALEKYNNANNLAENIENYDDDEGEEYIHHIYEDINYYLSDFLRECKSENILGVITQENLFDDFRKIFNIDIDEIVESRKNNSSMSKDISDTGSKLLKKYLWRDYECIEKLYKMGCLTEKQYTKLSK
uniref:Sulfotransferase domain-containing protein n=1 Tax=viral metagenome TaxID=1070528 RepID=A0A6C0DY68_9ZZZZ